MRRSGDPWPRPDSARGGDGGRGVRRAGAAGELIGQSIVKVMRVDPSDTEGRSNRWDQKLAIDLEEDSQVGPDASTGANVAPEPSPP